MGRNMLRKMEAAEKLPKTGASKIAQSACFGDAARARHSDPKGQLTTQHLLGAHVPVHVSCKPTTGTLQPVGKRLRNM